MLKLVCFESIILERGHPLVGDRIEALDAAEEGGAVVAATGVDLAVKRGHAQPTPLRQHRHRLNPAACRRVVYLRNRNEKFCMSLQNIKKSIQGRKRQGCGSALI